ncbi:hypothetical protein HF078_04390 [Bacillus sp. RO2]|nr:hypothetical protein [Bacillus sp. RO2]NMH72312.1 hypothetical protein [Bacillus sp. RO2]
MNAEGYGGERVQIGQMSEVLVILTEVFQKLTEDFAKLTEVFRKMTEPIF